MKTFYLQVNSSGLITDAIDYPYGDYVEVTVASLPVGVNGGWFKLENGVIVEHLELKPVLEPTNKELNDNQLILMDVLGTMYEDMLAKGTV